MTSLQLASKARLNPTRNPVATLYRSIIKEVPRVLIIFNIDQEVNEVNSKIKNQFYKNGNIKDSRVKSMLVEKGYMELQETLLQYKQKTHVERLIDGYVDLYSGADRKRLRAEDGPLEYLARD